MGSESIAAEMATCRIKIEECCKEIIQIEKEIEELEKSLRIGDTAKQAIMDNLDSRRSRINSIDSVQRYALAGNRYILGMDNDLTSQKTIHLINSFNEQRDFLQKQILASDTDLENKKEELSRLNRMLGDLDSQYNTALRQEEWDREQERKRQQEEWDRKVNQEKK